MTAFQVQLEATLAGFTRIATMMQAPWAWPLMESVHFIGLTLLLGSIAAWDLRLLGMMRDVPIAAFHRLVPFAVVGFIVNLVTGFLFLVTYPDQYVYNPAFQFKMMCVLLAGVNVLFFYAFIMRDAAAGRTTGSRLARWSGGMSLILWLTIIVSGRMITFFRPTPCKPGEFIGFLATCIVR